jgi:hypothetical protein
MSEEKCPCCSNHCSKDNLKCGRGKEYFNSECNVNELNSLNEKVIMDLRKCGHILHHNRDLNEGKLLFNFSEDEINQLHELLVKFYSNAEKQTINYC